MDHDFAAAMGRALEQTRAANPAEATRIIQAALAGRPEAAGSGTAVVPRPSLEGALRPYDAEAPGRRQPSAVPGETAGAEPSVQPRRRSLRDVVEALGRRRGGPPMPMPMTMPGQRQSTPPPVADGAVYVTRTFSGASGARDYRLYVPAALPDGPQGLVLMLHGCTQDADDFAGGTRMNALAERHRLIVAYPNQTRLHNGQGCWNWFRPADQGRGGEAAILAGLAVALREEFDLAQDRVFAAGLSAGGAMAAILGASYPDVFSAVGIHSGLPHGSAQDLVSAFAAMRGEGGGGTSRSTGGGRTGGVRTIVFHGTADGTVHPSNADQIMRSATAGVAAETSLTAGRSAGGRPFNRHVATGRDGVAAAELWLIEGAGHAWSGGASTGSYTDPSGPDASGEMVRFFLRGPAR